MHQNKSGFVTHAISGFDALRRLVASGVAHECRTPGTSAWALTAGQVERLEGRFVGGNGESRGYWWESANAFVQPAARVAGRPCMWEEAAKGKCA